MENRGQNMELAIFGETTPGADISSVCVNKQSDIIFAGTDGTVKVFPGISFFKGPDHFTITPSFDPAIQPESQKAGKTDTETIGKTVSVGIVKQVEPVKEKHDGNPYMQGVSTGLFIWIVIYIIYRKITNRKGGVK